MSSTRERLSRLFSTGKQQSPLSRIERELLGDEAPNLSLKERLERLVAAAQARPRVPEPRRAPERRPPRSLRDCIPEGEEVENELGTFFRLDRFFPLGHKHGRIELGRLLEVPRGSFSVLARGSEEAEIALERALFVDVETTGLAGGSGTYAFLIGLGFVEDDTFVLRQLFMRDYREEGPMLLALKEAVSRSELLVSYNGKSFDLPLLASRFVLTRQSFSFEDRLHFDLLHPARSLWKARFESCRLAELEHWLLGIEREHDLPGHLIPDVYFRFVRTGDATHLPRVFEHNAHDILSLAALTVSASDMLDEENLPENPIDDFSLGRIFERVLEPERSIRHYGRAVASGLTGAARKRSLRGLAELHKRRGELERARELWEELSREEGIEAVLALHELAMMREHRERDFAGAAALCETALERLESAYELPLGFRERWRESFAHRRRRLRRRLGGRGPDPSR